jgi:hypothetical protein
LYGNREFKIPYYGCGRQILTWGIYYGISTERNVYMFETTPFKAFTVCKTKYTDKFSSAIVTIIKVTDFEKHLQIPNTKYFMYKSKCF